jgi:hypothetical protein
VQAVVAVAQQPVALVDHQLVEQAQAVQPMQHHLLRTAQVAVAVEEPQV